MSSPLAFGPWPVYVTNEPDSPDIPDNIITVYNTAGTYDGRSMVDGIVNYHYGFQVRVRAADEPTGWQKLSDIRQSFQEDVYDNVLSIGGNTYKVHAITKIGEVLGLGTESPTSRRRIFTLNCTMVVSPL